MPLRRLALCALCLSIALCVIVSPRLAAADSTIGLYIDESGSNCSFSGNNPGIVTAYVVVKADPSGVMAVRFSAPLPPCLGATFLYETAPDGVNVIGSSQTDISVAFPTCVTLGAPAVALQVNYMRNGSTSPCCAFPVVAALAASELEVTDCAFNSHSGTGVTSHFNADATCGCVDTSAPQPPTNPSPADNATNVTIFTGLAWQSSPLDDVAEYDVYFGPTIVPPFIGTTTDPSFPPQANLQMSTDYYWRVVVRNTQGLATSGPTWKFTTTLNEAPSAPTNPSPADGATNLHLNATLSWSATDMDNDPLTYDVYFGSSDNPPLVASGKTTATYTPVGMHFSGGYRWRIVVHDDHGHAVTGPLWHFITKGEPSGPTPVYPLNGAFNVSTSPTLSWSSTDPAGDALRYDVFLSSSPTSLPGVASNIPGNQYAVFDLAANRTYYWKIVVHDAGGGTVTGPVWSFFTGAPNSPPSAPNTPTPANVALNVALDAGKLTLGWNSTDPNGDPLTYQVYFGTTSIPPLIDTVSSASRTVTGLSHGTTYHWSITASDNRNGVTPGPVWTFVTADNTLPSTSGWSPAASAVEVPPGVTLTWQGSDADGDVTTYDVYFAVAPNPVLVATNLTAPHFTPGPLALGTTYAWFVLPRDATGPGTPGDYMTFTTTSATTGIGDVPRELTLGRNHPNPFNPQTAIPYTVPAGSPMRVRIAIFDATGRAVRVLVDETQSAGAREIIWRGDNEAGAIVSSGIYYCVMDAGGKRFMQKLVLLK